MLMEAFIEQPGKSNRNKGRLS
jgi:hypothetical protein